MADANVGRDQPGSILSLDRHRERRLARNYGLSGARDDLPDRLTRVLRRLGEDVLNEPLPDRLCAPIQGKSLPECW